MSSVAIQVEDLGKRYRIGGRNEAYGTLRDSLVSLAKAPLRSMRGGKSQEFWALRDVSFDVKQGEVLGIIGRNGAGKSTLLKILSRITEPTTGQAEIKGRVGSLLEVGTGFHPELTGRENIYLNGAILGMTKRDIERCFDEIVEFAEVEQFLETPVKRYSSGMYTRLAFSIAAHLEPEVLIVDEVLAVGDSAFRQKSMGRMGTIAQQGRTVLFVSHNMAAIKRLCRTCVLLDKGRVQSHGPAKEVVAEYLRKGTYAPALAEVSLGDPETAVIQRIGVTDKTRGYASTLEADEDFFIEVDFNVISKIDNCQLAVAVLSVRSGETVFVTTHRDSSSSDVSTLFPGNYRARIRVPGGFINVGTFSLNVRIWGSTINGTRSSIASAMGLVSFSVEETGSIASKLMDRRGGYVTPILDWELNAL